MADDPSTDVLAKFRRKYFWWTPVDGRPFSEDRVIAQTMSLATYDDILLLERTVGWPRLADVMCRAEPGWIDDRSWDFWRGRLNFRIGSVIPEKAPRRVFHDATP
jgi:hypothetical protein